MVKYLFLFLMSCWHIVSYAAGNDECADAIQLTPVTTLTYTNGSFSGMSFSGTVPACAMTTSQDVWYKFTATDVTMSITLSEVSGLNHGFEIYQGGCNGTVWQCVNATPSYNYESYFNNNFIPGQEYYIRVLNTVAQLSTATFGICVRKYPTPANDICANAITLTPNTTCVYTNGTFSGAMLDGGTPSCATAASQDVWYKFTATDKTMSITLSDVQYLNHGFEIYQGGCNGTVWQCVNANIAYNYESYFNNNFIPGQEYYIRVLNASANLSTSAFGICVAKYPSPANDICANAITLAPNTACTYTYGTFSGAMMDGGTPSCAPATSQDVWYKFTATDKTMSITLSDVQYLNHGFEIYQGGCNGTVWQCINANIAYNYESYFNNNFIPGQEYYIRVFNASANLNTSTFGICVVKYPSPVNDLCENAVTLIPNASCTYTTGTFSGAMMDGVTPSCATAASQDIWYKFTATDVTMGITLSDVQYLNHGFEIYQGGCNGPVLQCINANIAYNYESYLNNNFIPGEEYYIRVLNASANLNTSAFGICITKYPTPSNDLCANATEIIPATSCTYINGSFSGASLDGGPAACAMAASQDVWYKFTATDKTMSITLSEVQWLNHGFEIFQGGCNGTVLQCINAVPAYNSENYFNNNFIPGQVYYIRVFNVSSAINTYSFGICVRKYPSPVNDVCTNALELTPYTSCSYTTGTFSGAMMDGDTPPCGTLTSQDVWYKFIATSGTMAVQLSAVTGVNHGFQLFEGSCNGTQIACINQSGLSASEYASFTSLTIGQTYYIRVLNISSSPIISTFSICLTGPHPTTCTPSNQVTSSSTAICLGESVTFNASPTHGGTSPNFQWKVNGSNVGTNSSSYTTSTLSNGAIISCVLTSNAACASTITTTGNNITMPVSTLTSPVFTQIPAICSGAPLTLPVTSNNGISGTWSPAVNNRATTTYTFTPYGGQCSSTASMTVSVNGGVTPTFTQVSAICFGESFTLPTTSNNGISGTWSPAIDNAVTKTYTFTPNAAGPCASTTTMTVIVNNITPLFTQIPAICVGGSFTFPTTSNNGINGTWSPAINNMTTTTYTFTPNAGQCGSTATMTVTVNNAIPAFTPITAICAGGSFTLPTTSNNGINGTWSPAINNTATTMYTFTPNAGQCASPATMTVAINNNATMPAFTQIPAICSGGSFVLPTTSNNGISGTWSPAISNTVTTLYTFTPNVGQCGSVTTMTVTVNNSIAPMFNQIPAVCSGGLITLPTTSNNGISGTWSPAINNTVTTTYTFTPTAGQCASTAMMTVTVNNGLIPAFTQIPDICSGASFTLPTISNNGISGTWSPAVNTTATTTYTFTPTSGQCVETTTMTVIVNFVNAGTTTQGNTITASATGATYHWINCADNQPINGATNAAFTPTENGSYAVVVTQNGCAKTSDCVTITTLGMEALVQNGWNIYPNPAIDQLFITLNEATEIVIMDMTGKAIQYETLKSGNNTVNVNSLTPGVYFIKAVSGATNVKFVKK